MTKKTWKDGMQEAIAIVEEHAEALEEHAVRIEQYPDERFHPGAKSEILAQLGHARQALLEIVLEMQTRLHEVKSL